MPIAVIVFLIVNAASVCFAHPMIENGLDVVIGREQITIDAKISPEEIFLTQAAGATAADQQEKLDRQHAAYVAKHLRVEADHVALEPSPCEYIPATAMQSAALLHYRLHYVVSNPKVVHLDQSFLRERPTWSASCVLRIRQSDQSSFDTTLLTAHQTAEYVCDWAAAPAAPVPAAAPAAAPPPAADVHTQVRVWDTIRAYTAHGIMHILTGYDHLLFVSALVLAATSFWDLIKVVSAFTLAHTMTLTLSVFNIVTLSERIVEPMIAASIIFVAFQNIFWPERSRGWTRLSIAFGFGLFHGLGFAGGLKDAMADMPAIALWAALAAFSLGVEIGHQVVVIPLFAALHTAKNWNAQTPRFLLADRTRQICSVAICFAGGYFLVEALKIAEGVK